MRYRLSNGPRIYEETLHTHIKEIAEKKANDLIRLDGSRPFIDVRAITTKAKRAAVIPLVPIVADALRSVKARGVDFTGRVFPRGLPSVATLAKDLAACGIAAVDFHALRHTFASILANVGVPSSYA